MPFPEEITAEARAALADVTFAPYWLDTSGFLMDKETLPAGMASGLIVQESSMESPTVNWSPACGL